MTYNIFKKACIARGLIKDDNYWIRYFEKSVFFLYDVRLRALFVIALIYGDIINPNAIWEQFRVGFSDNLPFRLRQLQSVPEMEFPEQDYILYLIKQSLIEQRKILV
jgi:hypothetical protein